MGDLRPHVRTHINTLIEACKICGHSFRTSAKEVIKTELREYQNYLVYKIKVEINAGKRAICAVLGCGGGKSVIQGTIAANANRKGNRVLFLVHRKELCEQIRNTFTACGVDWNLTTVDMVQTVTRHIKDVQTPNIIITDECHLSTAKTYIRIYEAFPDALKLGFTATPCRLNEGGLGDVYDSLVEGVSTRWLIDQGHLADYRHYSLPLADTSGLHVRSGEFRAEEIKELMEKRDIYGKTVETWKRIAEGKKTIVYCASVSSSKETADLFNENGIAAAHLDGSTGEAERAEMMRQFRAGQITVLCNCELFSVGLDVPDCECVILLRPTQSLTLYIQQAMRCMRADRNNPGKVGIIIDHVGNIYRHGFVDDPHNWSLEPKKRKEENLVKIKECPQCYTAYSAKHSACPVCGYEHHVVRETKGSKTIEVDLKEVRRIADIKALGYNEYHRCSTWDELAEFQKAKGYKVQWTVRKAIELGISVPKKYAYMRKVMRV